MTRFQLANGRPIDELMVEEAMDDANRGNLYFLNTETGEVLFLSELDAFTDEREQELEEIDGSDVYIPIERIDSSTPPPRPPDPYGWVPPWSCDDEGVVGVGARL
jgi:hypothetical protein